MNCVPLNRGLGWRTWRWLALTCLFPVAVARPLGLTPTETPAAYISAHWDTEDGLPHNNVRCILQTRDGYLWVGTQQGLARFDGLSFTVFNQHNTPALHNNRITSLAETRDGSLWIGTASGLVRYQAGRFSGYGCADGLKADTVNGLCLAPDGALWIGSPMGVTRWQDGKFVNDIDTFAYDMLGLRFMGRDRHQAIWLATGCDAFRYADGKFTHFGPAEGLPAKSLRSLGEDAEGNMLAATSGGLLRLRDGQFVPFEQNAALGSERVECVLADSAGNLWIGSLGGLDRYANGKLLAYTNHEEDKITAVTALYEGREPCLWVGTSTGLYRLTERQASLLPLAAGAPETMVNTLCQTRDGALWIGKWFQGVDCLHNGVTTHYAAGAPLSPEPVTAIYAAADGSVWFGNRGSSIERLDGNKVTTFAAQPGGVSSRAVTVMYQDPDGEFLLGISRRGLLQFRDGRITPVPEAKALVGDTVWTITRTRDGRLLMGTDKGLYQRNPDRTWKRVALAGRNYMVGARALLEENDGTIWIATDGDGVVRWRTGNRLYDEPRDVGRRALQRAGRPLWLVVGQLRPRHRAHPQAGVHQPGPRCQPHLELPDVRTCRGAVERLGRRQRQLFGAGSGGWSHPVCNRQGCGGD
jgi:ligand-binding sensor domain-containing protein